MNTGEALRQKRLSKNISIRKLAKASGVTTATIYRIEKNISKPHKVTMNALDAVLNNQEDEACQTTDATENQ